MTQAVHRWGPEIHEGIYDMLHLLLNLVASRLRYKPVPFGLLELLTQVIIIICNTLCYASFLIWATCHSAEMGWSGGKRRMDWLV